MERNDPLRRGFKSLESSFALALRDRCAWVDSLDQPQPLILSREDVQAFLCGGESGSGGGGGAGAAAPLPPALQPGGAAAAPSPAASLVSSVAALRGEDLPFPGAAAQLARLRALGGGGGGPPPPPPSAVQARLAAALERPSDAGDDPPRPPPPPQQLVEPPPLPPAHAAYRRFVARLKEPAAVDVAYAIREWLKQFCARDFAALYKQLPDEDAFMFAGEDDGGQEEEVEEQEKEEAPPPPPPPQQQQQLQQHSPPLGGAGTEAASVAVFAPRAPARAPRPPSPAEQFHGFLSSLEEKLRKHPLWRGESGAAREATLEAAERFVTAGFHARLHCAHPRSARRDAALARRLAALSFVTHAHLDLPPPSARTARGWRLAQAALSAMADFAAPADKLRCIMNACLVLVGVLAAAAEEASAAKAAAAAARGAAGCGSESGGSANAADAVRAPSSPSAGASFGADDFLPALIFTVIHAGPRTRGLYSCLRVISEFRPPAKLNGEEGYFFTNIVSAVQFCKNPKLNPAAGGGGGAQPSPAGAAARAEGAAEFLAMLEAGGGLQQQRLQQQQKQQQQVHPLLPLLAPPPLSPKEAGERLRAALQRIAKEVAASSGAARSLDDAPAALQGLLRARSRLLRLPSE
jgi:hypothetical protein